VHAKKKKTKKKQYSHNKHTMLSATLRIDAAFHINKLCNVYPEATEKQTIIFAKWSITLHSVNFSGNVNDIITENYCFGCNHSKGYVDHSF